MKHILYIILIFTSYTVLAQNRDNSTVLETRFRNPIDTLHISRGETLTIVLFVHSNCLNEQCATKRMQKALEQDSLNLRLEHKIKLYVVYPFYNTLDIIEFDTYNPQDAIIAFDINNQYRNRFKGNPNITPFIVLFDGEGNEYYQEGGTYGDLYQWVNFVLSNK